MLSLGHQMHADLLLEALVPSLFLLFFISGLHILSTDDEVSLSVLHSQVMDMSDSQGTESGSEMKRTFFSAFSKDFDSLFAGLQLFILMFHLVICFKMFLRLLQVLI